MIQSITFTSLQPGPRFLVLGAVHGDEKCGTHAIRRIIKEIEEKIIVIECGSVTFVPICNPQAFDANTRFIDRNLNRYLVPQDDPDCYEAQIGNALCPILEQCDVLLDLHSYHSGKGSYVYVGSPGSPEHAFAETLGATAGITGWKAAYAASGREQKAADTDESTGTTEYARKFGTIALTMECGQHKAEAAVTTAYRAIRNALRYLCMISDIDSSLDVATLKLIEVKRVFYRGNGGAFTKEWVELDAVRKNDIIAVNENNVPVVAPDDGYLLLPHAKASVGSEWFYWGQER